MWQSQGTALGKLGSHGKNGHWGSVDLVESWFCDLDQTPYKHVFLLFQFVVGIRDLECDTFSTVSGTWQTSLGLGFQTRNQNKMSKITSRLKQCLPSRLGTVLSILCTTLWVKYYCLLHFTVEKTEVQKNVCLIAQTSHGRIKFQTQVLSPWVFSNCSCLFKASTRLKWPWNHMMNLKNNLGLG